MSNQVNTFIDLIYKKKKLSFFGLIPYLVHRKSVKAFKNKINKCSPGFEMLWDISDFIKIAEYVFFYDNSMKTEIGLFSSDNYQKGTNGFRIYDDNCNITLKLFRGSKTAALEVERTSGNKKKSMLSFKNESWEKDPTIYDEMMIEQVIKAINKKTLLLFDYCYELR